MRKLAVIGAALGICAALSLQAVACADVSWESKRGLYRVSFTSTIDPLQINRIHDWIVRIETTDGRAVERATVSVTGGMPEHDHGLPTSPRVTEELGDGAYRVQGMRFHMAGLWQIEISIDDGERTDTAAIDLEL